MRTALLALAVSLWMSGNTGAEEPTESPGQASTSPGEPAPTPAVEEILIKGRREADDAVLQVAPERSTPSAADTAQLLDLVPGGALNWNGPLSGQVQYRGMAGPRMGVRVGGVSIEPGGPNWMDPPLHYAPRALLDSLDVERGIASVSSGAETIGGAVRARLKQSDFSDDGRLRFQSDLEVEGRSVDGSVNGGGLVSVADDRQRLELLGSADRGSSFRSALGRVRNTRFERYQVGSAYALRLGEHVLGAGYRFHDTEDTGTPALPMDIRFLRTHLLNAHYTGSLGQVELEGRVYYNDVDHQMDNFSLRPQAGAFRFVEATGRGGGWEVHGAVPLSLGQLVLGSDGHLAVHDADVFDPNNPAFRVQNFNAARRDRFGAFAEWRAEPLRQVSAEVGVRYTRVEMDAGPVSSPPPLAPLRDAFNAARRQKSDDNVDWVIKLVWTPREELSLDLAGGRKTRSPYHIERYQWAPLEITGGLADGRTYVGDIDLDPEISHELTGGLTWRGFGFYASPRGFYRRVDDYIQGTPDAGTPADLRFSNVDAELYGADADLGVDLPGPLQLDGSISYVRGLRRDVRDDLYRIAPLRGRATLSWQAESWFAGVEGIFAARQEDVSATNGETPTPGYEIMNLYAGWEPWPGLHLMAGIDNVTDAAYRDHLAGFNRVADSAVPVGDRLPGAGRSFYGRAKLRWGTEME